MRGQPMTIEGRPVERLMIPFAHFARLESAGSVALLTATLAALALANSPLAGMYREILELPVSGSLGNSSIHWTLRDCVTDALMALFFLLVGLEVKREFTEGGLASVHRALLPLLGAVGGVAAPALIYGSINRSGAGVRGRGIPIATDIAFALAVLALFGRRIPVGLRMFLLTLAVVDDIAGVLVIAVAYSGPLQMGWLGIAFLLFLLCLGLNRLGVVSLGAYLGVGAGLWCALYASGIHATLAGIALALAVPAKSLPGADRLLEGSRACLAEIARSAGGGRPLGREERVRVHRIRREMRLLESPLDRMESRLHPWVSFGILPLFALANAGVGLGELRAEAVLRQPVFYGVLAGLLLGKPLGITLAMLAGGEAEGSRVAGESELEAAACGCMAWRHRLHRVDLHCRSGLWRAEALHGEPSGHLYCLAERGRDWSAVAGEERQPWRKVQAPPPNREGRQPSMRPRGRT